MAIINQQLGQEFESRFKTLPEDIQHALTAVASVDTIFAIGKKHGLMVDQIGKMADEIWKVMLGLANPKDFIRNLASALGIESEKASAIASEVNAQMFQPVRESLRKIYDSSTPPVVPITPQIKMPPASLSPSAPSYGAYPKGGGKEDNEISPLKMPSMIYPQDRFEEEFKKEPEQIAPLPPATIPAQSSFIPPLSLPLQPSLRATEGSVAIPQSKDGIASSATLPRNDSNKDDDFTYSEKTKEISRESTKGREYQGKDPYREQVE